MNDHNQPRETQYTLGENAVAVQVRIALGQRTSSVM